VHHRTLKGEQADAAERCERNDGGADENEESSRYFHDGLSGTAGAQ
jgi:hypothetical protein